MINKVSFSSIAPSIRQASAKIGEKINSSNGARKFVSLYDANGFDNSFIGLMSLMISTVIIPRFLTAKNRNPEDKEATKDEIKEVLFRDIQTCTIMLFALKMLNTIIANGVGKKIKLPMTNKQFKKVFDTKGISNRVQEFIHAPKEKLKTVGENLLDFVHPTGGVKAYSDKKFAKEYSKMDTPDKIYKTLLKIDNNGGNSDTVMKNYVISDILAMLKGELSKAKHDILSGGDTKGHVKKLEGIIKNFEELSEKQNIAEKFKDNAKDLDKDVKNYFLEYFKNDENSLVRFGKRLNGGLNWLALGIESAYLGFGIPALNQRRLEKKYLKANGGKKPAETQNKENANISLINKNIKPEKVKLYHSFIK